MWNEYTAFHSYSHDTAWECSLWYCYVVLLCLDLWAKACEEGHSDSQYCCFSVHIIIPLERLELWF